MSTMSSYMPATRWARVFAGFAALVLLACASVCGAQTLTKSFSPSTVPSGTPSTMTIHIDTVDSISGIDFYDYFPAGMTAVSYAPRQCGGIVTSSDDTYIYVARGAIAAGRSCDINVQVVASPRVPTTYTNTVFDWDYVDANGGYRSENPGDSADLVVTVGAAPVITSGAPPNGTRGTPYGPFTVTASGTTPITFDATGLPYGLTLDPATGVLSGTPTSAGTYTGQFIVTNSAGKSAQDFTIVIALPTIGGSKQFVPSTILTGATTTVQVTLDPGANNFNYVRFSDVFPAGMTGVPSVTDQCAVNSTLTVTATRADFNGRLLAEPCVVTFQVTGTAATDTTLVNTIRDLSDYTSAVTPPFSASLFVQAGRPPDITTTQLDDGDYQVPYAFTITATGTAPITFSATGLPPGLTISTGGVISGTPTTPGTYTPAITATNAYTPADVQVFTLVIRPPSLSAAKSFSPASITSLETSKLSITLTNNGTAVIDGIGFSDPFPAGMTATPGTTTQCGGTVTLGTNQLTFTAGTVAANSSCTIAVTIKGTSGTTTTLINTTSAIRYGGRLVRTISGVTGTLQVVAGIPPRITNAPPGDGQVMRAYRHRITVTGTPVVSVTVTGLPPGLTFDPATLTISGTPTRAGTYNGTITATNAYAPPATQPFIIIISVPPLVIDTSTLPSIVGGQQVNVPIVAVGGIPPYQFDVLVGQLPPGLGFTPAGFLTGTPTLPGTYNFTVRATDSIGTTATRSYTIVIAKSTPAFTFTVSPVPAVAGQAVVVTATLSGALAAGSGQVQVWIAHSDERCPAVPGIAPIAAKTVSAALAATGQVQFTFADLPIDNYQVCGSYAGDARYKSADAGPVDLFVIKGALLGVPTLSLLVAPEVAAGAKFGVQAIVAPPTTSTTRVPAGNVVLKADGVAVASVPLSGGEASFTAHAPARTGSVTLTATYYGDGAYAPAVAAPRIVALKADAIAEPVPGLMPLLTWLLALVVGGFGALTMVRRRR